MEARYAKFVVLVTLALVATTASADWLSGFNFCNLNWDQLKACNNNDANHPSPECCNAIRGVDPKCICVLISSPALANNKEDAKNKLRACQIPVPGNC